MSYEIFPKYLIEYIFFCSTHGFDIQYASSQIGAAMLDSQLGRDLWRHARVKREVFRKGSAAVIWLV